VSSTSRLFRKLLYVTLTTPTVLLVALPPAITFTLSAFYNLFMRAVTWLRIGFDPI